MWAGTVRELMDADEARRRSEEALEMGRLSGFGPSIGSSTLDLALLDLAAGDVGAVEARLPIVAELARKIQGFHSWLFELRLAHLTAELALAQDRRPAALAGAQGAVEHADRLSRRKYQAMTRTTLSRAMLATGKPAEAAATARESVSLASGLGHPHTLWRAAAALAAACSAAGDDRAAEQAASTAADAVLAFASAQPDEHGRRVRSAAETSAILAAAGGTAAAG
jgi:hypothetical protein